MRHEDCRGGPHGTQRLYPDNIFKIRLDECRATLPSTILFVQRRPYFYLWLRVATKLPFGRISINMKFNLEVLEALFDKMKVFFKSATLMGKPIEAGNFILIPLLSISFGAGNGSAGGEMAKGAGTGAGGKVVPVALVAIRDNEIKLFSLNGKNYFEEINALMPEIMSSINTKQDNSQSS